MVLEAAVSQLTETVEEDGFRQAIFGLSLVQSNLDSSAQLDALNPVQSKQGAFNASQLAKREGYDLVLSEGVIFASGRVDVTDRVLERLRQAAERRGGN